MEISQPMEITTRAKPRALFIQPAPCGEQLEGFRSPKTYPVGLYSMSALLELHGFEAPIVDLDLGVMGLEDALGLAEPDVVGITAATQNRHAAIDLARSLRRLSPDLLIVVGGPHFTFTAADTLTRVPEIDIVVRGEGEYTMLEIMQSLQGAFPLESIAGVSFSAGSQVIHNPDRPPIPDLDQLPSIHWGVIPWDQYDSRFIHCMDMPCAHLLTSRGCPINCTFCSTTKMWGKYPRWRSASRVVDDIEYLLTRTPNRGIFLDDDTLTLSSRRVLGLCNEIERRGLDFPWSCNVRADVARRGLLERMRKAGCQLVFMGVESGSPQILESIGKRITCEKVIQTVMRCRELGIMCKPLFMYSLPGESDDDRRLTLELIEKLMRLGVVDFDLNATIIFPGTEVELEARRLGVLPPAFSWSEPFYDPRNAAILPMLARTPLYTESLSMEGILQLHERSRALKRELAASRPFRRGSLLDGLKAAPNFLWGFTSVRSRAALKKRLATAADAIAAFLRIVLRERPKEWRSHRAGEH